MVVKTKNNISQEVCHLCGMPFVLFFIFMLVACQKEDDIGDLFDINALRKVHVVYGINGLGDRSYNDAIYLGICTSKKNEGEFAAEQVNPKTLEQAEEDIAEWFAETNSSSNRLLILTQLQYASILEKHPEWKIPDGDAVLMLDTENALPSPWNEVYTRQICYYGTSYEAGILTASGLGAKKAAAIYANPMLSSLLEFSEGFIDGFKQSGGSFDDKNDIYFLAKNENEGFSNSVACYDSCSVLAAKGYDFVLPVCGSSMEGVFHYTRQHSDSFLTAGIINDMQAYSNNVAYSIVTRQDLLVEEFIKEWINGSLSERNKTYGMDSEYIHFELSQKITDKFPTIKNDLTAIQAQAVSAEKKHFER